MSAPFDPIADVLRAHDAGLVLLSGPLECPGHVLLPWFAHAALRGGGGLGGGSGARSDGASSSSSSSALVVVAAAHPPAAHAAALRKVQQQATQQTTFAPLPVVYVEPRLPGPDDDNEEDDDEGADANNNGGWLRRLSADVASAVRKQAEALKSSSSSSSAAESTGRRPPPPPQISVLVDSLTVLAAAADAGAGAASPTQSSTTITAPRPSPTNLRWVAFLHSLASLEAQAPAARVRVVALCADDVLADAPWRRWLRHRCAAALTLCPVEGRTAGLDGELRVEGRAMPVIDRGQEGVDAFGRGASVGAGGVDRCFFRASELSVRWLRDVQSADLMR